MRSHAITVFNGKLLLLLSPATPLPGTSLYWNLIGGLAQGDETPVQTLLREFEDYAAITPTDYTLLLTLPEETHIFLVRLSEDEARNVRIGERGIDVRFFSLEQLIGLPMYHRIYNEFPSYVSLYTRFLN